MICTPYSLLCGW